MRRIDLLPRSRSPRWLWALLPCLAGMLAGCDRYRSLGEIEVVFRGTEGALLTIKPLRGEVIELPFHFELKRSTDFRLPLGGSGPDAVSSYGAACSELPQEFCFLTVDFYGLDGPIEGRRWTDWRVWSGRGPKEMTVVIGLFHSPLLRQFHTPSGWSVLEYSFWITDGELVLERSAGMALVGRLHGQLQLYSTFSL